MVFITAACERKRYPPCAGKIQNALTARARPGPGMVKPLLQISGWLLAHTPEPLLRLLAWSASRLVYHGYASRRRLIHSNLHHAFPGRSAAWRAATARECLRRFVETTLLSLAVPYLPPERLRRIVSAAGSMKAFYAAYQAKPQPAVLCSPHLAHWEVQTVHPLVIEGAFPEFGIIFRPLDNAAADAFVAETRSRFGLKLLSRKSGLQEATRILRRGGIVGVLPDQNAGDQGALTLFFGRVCSTTELPGILAEKYGAQVGMIFPRYLGFWRVELNIEPVAHDGTVPGITIAINRWIENHLAGDHNACASWLWGHQRWKTQDAPARRLRLEQKRDFLADELRLRQLPALPRRTRLWIRLPNWLGDVVMALPLLRAIRAGRPDAEITFIAKPQFLPLLEQLGVADSLRPLPPRGSGYFLHFWRLRAEHPDCYLLFTNSTRGDLEAWLTRCRQRFGLKRAGHWRPLLTRAYAPPADFDEAKRHQLELWTDFLKHFGLAAQPDRTPLHSATPSSQSAIALICGSENNPEKRWPVAHWRTLIETLPQERFTLLGTKVDRALTDAVAAGFGDRVRNRAGETDLLQFTAALRESRLLVTNDTGGMHLANALGVPHLALFGPTNPVRTGPIFASPATILQPPGCPPTGGGSLQDLPPETVATALRELLHPAAF
jgi:ADP-heptose:LPS heptosyltransferase/lauroyl/myristoyl acyltransferase